jgi:hypothetical protein
VEAAAAAAAAVPQEGGQAYTQAHAADGTDEWGDGGKEDGGKKDEWGDGGSEGEDGDTVAELGAASVGGKGQPNASPMSPPARSPSPSWGGQGVGGEKARRESWSTVGANVYAKALKGMGADEIKEHIEKEKEAELQAKIEKQVLWLVLWDGIVWLVLCGWYCVDGMVWMVWCGWHGVDGMVWMAWCGWYCVDGMVWMVLWDGIVWMVLWDGIVGMVLWDGIVGWYCVAGTVCIRQYGVVCTVMWFVARALRREILSCCTSSSYSSSMHCCSYSSSMHCPAPTMRPLYAP